MANHWYDFGKQAIADSTGTGGVDYLNQNIVVVLLTSAYVVDLATHRYLSDIGAGARVATSGNLSGKTAALGVFVAANVTFPAVAGGSTVTQAAVYRNTGVEATSALLWHINNASNLPFVTDGRDVVLDWDVYIVAI